MFKIPVKRTVLSILLSTLMLPTFATSPLEEYVNLTLQDEAGASVDQNNASVHHEKMDDTTALPSIKTLLSDDHYTRHTALINHLDTIEAGALKNNPDSLFLLGYYYYSQAEDSLNDEDYHKASEYFKKAEKLGSTDASYLLGDTFYFGEGVVQDYQKAAQYYHNAGDQHAEALFSLGSLYMTGSGVTENSQIGVDFYTQAADLEHPLAQYTLGYLYESGDFNALEPDIYMAMAWYQISCENGETQSCDALKRLKISKQSFNEVIADIEKEHLYQKEGEPKEMDLPTVEEIRQVNEYEQFNALNYQINALIDAAKSDNPDATYLLGLYYQKKGDDYYDEYAFGQAKILFEKAAELGSIDALYGLGELYYYGNGVTQDHEKSFNYYSNPKLSDYPEAIFSVAVQYDLGEGVPQSYEQSFKHFQKASTLNHDQSTFNVGYMYENGEYVEKDLDKAKEWYQKSCDNGYLEGCIAVDTLTQTNSATESQYEDENNKLQSIFTEIMGDEASLAPLELTPISVLQATSDKARIYLNENTDQLLENIKNSNDPNSLFLMGYLFYLEAPYSVEDRYHQAYLLFEKAESAGSSDAIFYLGKLNYEGLGTETNYDQSFSYLSKLEESDNAEALFYLASLYDEGLGVEKDQNHSFNLYQKASNLGHADSTYNVGYMYEHGESVEKDLLEAQIWYSKACLLGDEDGCSQATYLEFIQSEATNTPEEIKMPGVEGEIRSLFDEILYIFAPE